MDTDTSSDPNGEIVCWSDDTTRKIISESPTGSGFVQVTVGHDHACALKLPGSIECWGEDTYGNLREIPSVISSATDLLEISAGQQHTCALQSSGQIACWGELSGTTLP